MEYNEEILEKCLPKYLEEDLKRLKKGIKNKVSYLDCLINELQGSVNSAYCGVTLWHMSILDRHITSMI